MRPSAATIAARCSAASRSEGSDVGVRPVASSATISLNCSGGSLRGVRVSLFSGPETVSVISMPRALVSRSILRIGSTFTGL